MPDRRYVADRGVVMTTDVSASLPISLALIEAIAGTARARAIADELGLASWDAGHDSDAFRHGSAYVWTVAWNTLAFWRHETIALPVHGGIDEIALAFTADAWSRTYRSGAVATAPEGEAVATAHGGGRRRPRTGEFPEMESARSGFLDSRLAGGVPLGPIAGSCNGGAILGPRETTLAGVEVGRYGTHPPTASTSGSEDRPSERSVPLAARTRVVGLRARSGNCTGPVARSFAAALLLSSAIAAVAPPSAVAQPFPENLCAADREGKDLGCTANDVRIAAFTVKNSVTSCNAGDTVTLDLSATLVGNATRYNIGLFLGRDGRAPTVLSASGGSADCAVFGLPTSPPPFVDADQNACGDFETPPFTASLDLGTVTVLCQANAAGQLSIPTVSTWDQNAGTPTSCQAPPAAWVKAGTTSKCSGEGRITIPVVEVLGSISITKLTAPAGSPGAFTFDATGQGVAPASFALSDGGTQTIVTGPLGATASTYTVTEQALAGYDPTAQISCVDGDGLPRPEFIVPNPATRSVSLQMSSNGTVGVTVARCTFTNTRLASITVVKNTVGGDATFSFTGTQGFSIPTAGGTGQHTLTDLVPGTYTISEIVPPGWDRTGLTCSDPTGGTTVTDGTATVALAAGESVTCTYTNTARGSIQVQKQSVGGDGTFSFTGAQSFQITTAGGVGGPAILSNLVPGTYMVSEVVPMGWDLTGLACTDPTGNTTTAGNTATIDLGPGETVSCTFTDTRRASITVEKVAVGADGTFGFTGSQSFAITTTTGNGVNTSAFASIPAGSPVTIVETVPAGWSLMASACRDAATSAAVGTAVPDGVSVTPGAGQAIVCSFIDIKLARLRVFKQAVPHSAQSFPFTAVGLTPDSFSLIDNGTDPNFITFADLMPGDYGVTEGAVAGWVLTDVTCSDVAEPDLTRRATVNRAARQVETHLAAGQNLDCTFTNTQIQPGTITINKQSVGAVGQFLFAATGTGIPSSFAITTLPPNLVGAQQFSGLSAGTYTITEQVPAGWDLVSPISCIVTQGTSTTVTPLTNGVSIALGTTDLTTDAVACQFVDVERGSITIVKSASPESVQPFTFTTESVPNTTPLPGTFQLVDSGTPPSSQTFTDLVQALYTVTEQALPGWQFSAIVCSGGSSISSNPTTRAVLINLQPGEDVTCTYANAQNATITVTKVAVGGAPGDEFTFTSQLPGLSGTIGNGESLSASVAAGTYATTEIVPDGWDLTNIACSGGQVVTYTGAGGDPNVFEPGDTTVTVTVGPGQSAACMYTDTRRGSIRIVKQAVGGDGAFVFGGSEDFEIATSGGSGEDATTFASVPPGTYTVTEIVPAGWRLTGIACTNASGTDLPSATATVSVAAGEAVTCTFTDARDGAITITKQVVGNQTGTFGFTVPPTLDQTGTFSLAPPLPLAAASRLFESVPAGSYTVTESSLPPGWRFEGIACTGAEASVDNAARSVTIALDNGQAAECTFVNAALATLTIGVISIGGTGTFGFDATGDGVDDFALTTPGDTVQASRVFAGLPPGSFAVRGLGAPGWQLSQLLCINVNDATSRSWTIVDDTSTIQLGAGADIACIFYYDLIVVPTPTPTPLPPPTSTPLPPPTPTPGPPFTGVPTGAPWALLVLAAALLAMGLRGVRRRSPR